MPVFLLLAGSAITGLAYLAFYSDFVKVRDVEIVGNKVLADSALLSLVESEIIKKDKWRSLFGTDNFIFWWGVSQEEIFQRLPLLANLEINTTPLEREIVITVAERKLRGVWCLADGSCLVFDNEGIVFANAPRIEGTLILKVTDENHRTLRLGEAVLPQPLWFDNLMNFLDGLGNEVILAVRIKSLELREGVVELAAGPDLHFSLESIPPELPNVLENLKRETNFSGLESVDFRVPNKIYYR